MQNEKSFDTGELTLNYFEGPNAGPALVLLHGLTANKLGWYPVLSELTKHYHVYAPDLRGHGKSGRAPDNQYHNVDYARDVVAFLKQIGEPVVLMGHSLGAMTAIVTAATYPEGLRALVLLDPPLYTYTDSVYLQTGSSNWFQTVAEVQKDYPSPDVALARMREHMPGVPEDQVAQTAQFIAGVDPGTVETALRDEIWQGVDLPHALQSIQCPTLMIHGDWDRGGAMREQDVEYFKTNCPAAHVVRLPDADHGLKMQEDPNLVLQALKAFVPSA